MKSIHVKEGAAWLLLIGEYALVVASATVLYLSWASPQAKEVVEPAIRVFLT